MLPWIASTLLLSFSLLAIVANWQIVMRALLGKSEARVSLIPLVAGLAGTTGVWLYPARDLRCYAWLPLALDWGSGLGLLTAPYFYVRYVRASRLRAR